MDFRARAFASRLWSYRGFIGAVATALLIVAIGAGIPLEGVPLTAKKAEATIVPLLKVRRPPQYGVASWYGDKEAGKFTASGAVFRPEELTAAHRWLPLGTKVRVTRLDTHRSVVVTINDRGPYVGGRVIDLSPTAFRQLSMLRDGLVRVRIDVLGEPLPAARMVKHTVKKRRVHRPQTVAASPHRAAPDKKGAPTPPKPASPELVDAKTPAPVADNTGP